MVLRDPRVGRSTHYRIKFGHKGYGNDGDESQSLRRSEWFPRDFTATPGKERRHPEFVKCFDEHFAASMGKVIETIPEETMQAIVSHSWPGNIRKLQSYVERGVILSKGGAFRLWPPDER